jgi:hypothetical protein
MGVIGRYAVHHICAGDTNTIKRDVVAHYILNTVVSLQWQLYATVLAIALFATWHKCITRVSRNFSVMHITCILHNPPLSPTNTPLSLSIYYLSVSLPLLMIQNVVEFEPVVIVTRLCPANLSTIKVIL